MARSTSAAAAGCLWRALVVCFCFVVVPGRWWRPVDALWTPSKALEAAVLHRTKTNLTLDGVELCQANCQALDRLVNSTRPTDTRPYPWAVAQFPTRHEQFCKLGCELFFTEAPNNATCKKNCDWHYRYDSTEQYSNLAVEAALECHDGCDIAFAVCQSGYYCRDGSMLPCPIGTYREPVTKPLLHTPDALWNLSNPVLKSVTKCIGCPTGKYRGRIQGKSTADCSLCPRGKFSDKLGATYVTDCVRCPAGRFGEYEGVSSCTCIDKKSCLLTWTVTNVGSFDYFNFSKSARRNPYGVDFFRETAPFIGRW